MRLSYRFLVVMQAVCMMFSAYAQNFVGDSVRLRPASLPSICVAGDLRIDSSSANALKICTAANTWVSVNQLSSNITAGQILYGDGTNVPISTSSFTFTTSSATLAVAGNVTASGTLRINGIANFGGNVTSAGSFIGTLVGNVTGSVVGDLTGRADTSGTASFATASSTASTSGTAAYSTVSGSASVTALADIAKVSTAFAATPTGCSANEYAQFISPAGNLTCAQVAFSQLSGTASIAQGGTNNGTLAVTAGGILYTDGTRVMNSDVGISGQFLKSNGSSAPSWVNGSITPWTACTITGSWIANVTYNAKCRDVGNDKQVQLNITATGAPTAADLTLNLPFTIDISAYGLSQSGFGEILFSGCHAYDTGDNAHYCKLAWSSTVAIGVYRSVAVENGSFAPIVTGNPLNNTAPFTFGATDGLDIYFQLPAVQ